MADEMRELREALETLGWSQVRLADELGINVRTVRRMVNGAARIPPPVLPWLRRMIAWKAQRPEPEDWNRPRLEDT